MKISHMVRAELRRLVATPMLALALFALLWVPILYGGLYLWANQNPYGRLGEIPAAVVVLDKGAQIEGKTRNLGTEVSVVQGRDVARVRTASDDRLARRTAVDEESLHPPLHPADPLPEPRAQGEGRLLAGVGRDHTGPPAQPRQPEAEIRILGDVERIPSAGLLQRQPAEVIRRPAERDRQPPGGERRQQDIEMAAIFERELARERPHPRRVLRRSVSGSRPVRYPDEYDRETEQREGNVKRGQRGTSPGDSAIAFDEFNLFGQAKPWPVPPQDAAVFVGRSVPGHAGKAEIGHRMAQRR